ncbi:hypothetical protein NM688_g2585 [Phlebia brevispora]|uniref:Uncharacterized protein n=1 Tax=Phlebia brevispora TaxID=194682 RepID=A0ACC1T8D5_9APHY|nr:hypothetical protein NM688_g2585 [Phlebia brevispora]
MMFDRERAEETLLTHTNGVIHRVQSVWSNFIGEYWVAVRLDDDDTLGVVVLGERRLDARVLDARPDPSSHDADFLGRDNVLEVALGLMIATAFTSVVNSLVSDILLPPISLLPFMSHKNLPEKFWILRSGPNGANGYNTLKQAAEDGAVTMAYGVFLDKTLTFMCLGLVLYGLAQMYGILSQDSIIKTTVKCPYCRKSISEKARRTMMRNVHPGATDM